MEIENEINNTTEIENNVNLENEQKNFFDTTLGKVVNSGIDFGLRAILPDVVENQIIEIKDAIIENGIKDGIKTATDLISDMGKSISGIFTGKFENLSQVQTAIGSGGVIDTISDLFDKAVNLTYSKGIINYQVKNLITKGKNIFLNNITSNIKNEMNYQEKSIQYIQKYINNFNDYYKNKDFEGMTKEYKKLETKMKEVVPLENIIKEAKKTESLYNLIKNNGNNFDLSKEEIELINKLN